MKNVIVAGDLVGDYNLVKYPGTSARHHDLPPDTVLEYREGGAWYLEDLITLACSDLDPDDINLHGTKRVKEDSDGKTYLISKAYQIWSLERKGPGSKAKEKIWRIKEFLGCNPCKKDKKSESAPLIPENHSANPVALVLDDLSLAFRYQEDLWPEALKQGRAGDIVIKTSTAPDRSPLWNNLLKNENADRLTVVLNASVLRERGAAISQGLSWDRTIEEVVGEFEDGISRSDLGRCRRVIVLFGYDGAAAFTRDKLKYKNSKFERSERLRFERFVYDPEHHEGTWRSRRTEHMFGTGGHCYCRHSAPPAAARGLPAFYRPWPGIIRNTGKSRRRSGAAGQFQYGRRICKDQENASPNRS